MIFLVITWMGKANAGIDSTVHRDWQCLIYEKAMEIGAERPDKTNVKQLMGAYNILLNIIIILKEIRQQH